MKNSAHILTFFSLLFSSVMAQNSSIINTTTSFSIGVLLDLDTSVGIISNSCISMAVSDFYATHTNYTTRLVLHTRDSKRDTLGAASMALDLLSNVQVEAIIGPQKSTQAEFVVDLGDKAHVPIVTFSATSPSLSSRETPYFIRTCQNDSAQVKAIAALVGAFRWKQVIPIYEDTNYGNGIIPYLINSLHEIDTRVPYRSIISPSATDDQIQNALYKLMTMQTRVFIVHTMSSLASRLFSKAKDMGMMNQGYAWIITDGLTDLLDSMDSSDIDSMQGILGVKPYVPKSKELSDFSTRWKAKFRQENPSIERAELSIFGLWAYDTIWALAMAAEKVGAVNLQYTNPETILNSTTSLSNFQVSLTGPKLRQALLETKFKGLGGEFDLVDGELESGVFQIVNVIGKSEKTIGYWVPTYGISKTPNVADKKLYSASMENLGTIIWPGDSTGVPRGWALPSNGKKLRIGVPVKDGFSEFIKVQRDPKTNETTVTGFCVDMFDSVILELPYAVPYEFVPFQDAEGKSAGDYNDLVYQVYLQNYDGVVGDVSILANRSSYVDFTMPFTESGVWMIVPIRSEKLKSPWLLFQPLTGGLWLTSGAAFLFTGFVVWVLEHRTNREFRGPPSQQLSTTLWFSFSTLVFAQKEAVVSNLGRFVMSIWMFVVLILTQTYTASLTSLLTVEKLQPTVTDVRELIKNGDYIGYQNGSFVSGILKNMKCAESKLRAYNTVEEYAEALDNGTLNGGVASIIEEVPYIKLFLAKYPDKYTMIGPIYRTDGFGFAFPIGSPLVPDISRAVLKIKEGPKMGLIEEHWLGPQTTFLEQSPKITSNSISLESFWGLFLITGIASTSALLIFFIQLVYQNRHVLAIAASENSIWGILVAIVKVFNQNVVNFATFFKRTEPIEQVVIQIGGVGASPYTSRSPSSISDHMVGNSSPEERSPSIELDNLNHNGLESVEK